MTTKTGKHIVFTRDIEEDTEATWKWRLAVLWNADYRTYIQKVLGKDAYQLLEEGRGSYLAGTLDEQALRASIREALNKEGDKN